jgi:formylmethanofuran dehydrogenase subunit B
MPKRTEPVVCLGCGCACDDIAITVEGGRITAAERACPLGQGWFGDGQLPAQVRVGGADVALEVATARAAELLHARPALVYLAPGLATEAQRAAIALADLAGSRLDSVTSDTGASSILAGQRRGRATATLGEIRHRADVLVFWGIDPSERYPRFRERYIRTETAVVAVDIGAAHGPADAAERFAVPAALETAALGVMRAVIMGRALDALAGPLAEAAALAERMTRARYLAIVHDAEPAESADPQRAEGLIGLAQALNVPTRCALMSLRAGGNRSGADSAMTWQTGYPFAVDFTLGVPRYRADEPASDVLGELGTVLIAGEAGALPPAFSSGLGGRAVVVVGPRASETPLAEVAVDTGMAGIHDGGTAYRLDDVPLPLTPVLAHPRSTGAVLEAIAGALVRQAVHR